MNFSLISQTLKTASMCIIPIGDHQFQEALEKYIQKKHYHAMQYRGSNYIVKEVKRG